MSTGILVSDEIVINFNAFKLGHGEKLRGFIYKIDDSKTIVIAQKLPLATSWEDVVDGLLEDESRYLLFDFEFVTSDGRPTSGLVFIAWNPEFAPVKQKMLYSGSKESLKTALNGVGIHINAQDRTELDKQTITDVVRRFAE